jgi:fucose permease
MLTYLTKGPAKFELSNFFTTQTLFWAFFILGRFLAALLAFKLSTLVFFSLMTVLNIVCLVLYVIPALNSIQLFYWFIVCAIGLFSGPLIPSCFMVAKEVLVDVNSFLVSIFCVGLGIGALSSQYLTGTLLDKFNPAKNWLGYTDASSAYIIPLYLFAWLILTSITYLFIVIIHKTFKPILDEESDDN